MGLAGARGNPKKYDLTLKKKKKKKKLTGTLQEIASKVLTVAILAIWEKVSVESKPSCCVKPLATSLALYPSMVLLELYFTL